MKAMTTWTIDPAHSEIRFGVKHMVISTVTGQFRNFKGTVMTDSPGFENASVQFEADVESISTGNDQRDAHLKSADFFDAAHYPKLTFVGKSMRRLNDDAHELVGDMTIRGVRREIVLAVTYNGTVKGFDGDIAAFEISGRLNRQDFGLHWNALTETGGIVVGNDVKLDVVVELKKAVAEEALVR